MLAVGASGRRSPDGSAPTGKVTPHDDLASSGPNSRFGRFSLPARSSIIPFEMIRFDATRRLHTEPGLIAQQQRATNTTDMTRRVTRALGPASGKAERDNNSGRRAEEASERMEVAAYGPMRTRSWLSASCALSRAGAEVGEVEQEAGADLRPEVLLCELDSKEPKNPDERGNFFDARAKRRSELLLLLLESRSLVFAIGYLSACVSARMSNNGRTKARSAHTTGDEIARFGPAIHLNWGPRFAGFARSARAHKQQNTKEWCHQSWPSFVFWIFSNVGPYFYFYSSSFLTATPHHPLLPLLLGRRIMAITLLPRPRLVLPPLLLLVRERSTPTDNELWSPALGLHSAHSLAQRHACRHLRARHLIKKHCQSHQHFKSPSTPLIQIQIQFNLA